MSKSENTLEEIAHIVYYGGLDGMTETEAIDQIRDLVWPWIKTEWRQYNDIGKAGFPVKSVNDKLAHCLRLIRDNPDQGAYWCAEQAARALNLTTK